MYEQQNSEYERNPPLCTALHSFDTDILLSKSYFSKPIPTIFLTILPAKFLIKLYVDCNLSSYYPVDLKNFHLPHMNQYSNVKEKQKSR